jgi:hypothetical protein
VGRVWRVASAAGVTAAMAVAAGCGSSAPDAFVGIGATTTAWNAHHGAEYTSVVADAAGRVEAYVVTMSPRPLAQAEALVRRDLPADTTASTPRLGRGVEGLVCEIVQFTSPTLGHLFGTPHGDLVVATFAAENVTHDDPSHTARAVVISGAENRPTTC